jgi:general stress protein 26
METPYVITEGLALISRSKIAMLGSLDQNGYPNIKAMLNLEHEELKTIWFSTNTSSKRVAQFHQNPKACVYYVDQERFMGLMLAGNVEVLQDPLSRQRLWRPGFEMYYPLWVDDPDYSVLCFTSAWGNFYHGLSNLTFEV